jgi:multifunctional 2-oxoglutarate metabolism enzyme
MQMINAYRVRGHLIADLDPLGAEPSYHPELDPETYGLTIWDLDREFLTGSLGEPSAKPAPSRSPRCARFWRRCAKPTAAKSAAST